jgi:hypothetical protein
MGPLARTRSPRRATPRLAALSSVLLAAACGGDDAPAVPSSVNPTNAQQVAEVVGVFDLLTGLTGLVGFDSGGGPAPTSAGGGVFPTDTESCTEGGTATWTIDDQPPMEVVSTGDVVYASFASCGEGGETINGSATIAFMDVTGDPDTDESWNASVTMDVPSLSIDGPEEDFSLGCNMTLSFMSDAVGLELEMAGSVSGTFTDPEGTMSAWLQGLLLRAVHVEATTESAYSLDASAWHNGELPGNYTVLTVSDFVVVGEGQPTSGVMLITAEDGSQLRITALSDGLSVQLEVDADGDGTFEHTETTTWDAL